MAVLQSWRQVAFEGAGVARGAGAGLPGRAVARGDAARRAVVADDGAGEPVRARRVVEELALLGRDADRDLGWSPPRPWRPGCSRCPPGTTRGSRSSTGGRWASARHAAELGPAVGGRRAGGARDARRPPCRHWAVTPAPASPPPAPAEDTTLAAQRARIRGGPAHPRVAARRAGRPPSPRGCRPRGSRRRGTGTTASWAAARRRPPASKPRRCCPPRPSWRRCGVRDRRSTPRPPARRAPCPRRCRGRAARAERDEGRGREDKARKRVKRMGRSVELYHGALRLPRIVPGLQANGEPAPGAPAVPMAWLSWWRAPAGRGRRRSRLNFASTLRLTMLPAVS